MSNNNYRNPGIEADLDIIREEQLDEENPELQLPDQEERDLETIRDLALKAYKSQMDDLMHVEPKNRTRFLEVAQKFLNEANNAQWRLDQLKVMKEKLELQKKKNSKPSSSDTDGSEGNGSEEGTPRSKLFEKAKVKSGN